MGRTFVVDASAAAKQFFAEPGQAALVAWIGRARDDGADLLAPSLLRYELGHTMAKQVRRGIAWTPTERARLLEEALLGFRFLDPGRPEPYAPPLSFYDAAYLALAKETKATLVTYDATLAAAAKRRRIRVLAPK